MKFNIENLRQIRQAEIELGDLTIVCGKNNVGKSYLAYVVYSFLSTIGFNLRVALKEKDFDTILKTGSCNVSVEEYLNDYEQSLKKLLPVYAQNIARFLAISKTEKLCPSFDFSDIDERFKVFWNTGLMYGYAISEKSRILFEKENESYELICTINNEGDEFPEKDKLLERASYYFSMILNHHILPEIHCMTGERSGISLFGTFLKQLNNPQTRQEYFKHRGGKNGESLLYPKPILDEIDMFLNLDVITKSNSMFTASGRKKNKILDTFKKLAGGTYSYENGVISYLPDGTEDSLFLREVSSSVKALVGLNFYLRHQAQSGDILMIDEPELNLHPANQRIMARLLAMLVNAGIKVFVTTHSDYIIREFNTLIMLNAPRNKRLKAIAEELGYDKEHDNCLLEHSKVRCYVVKDGTAQQMDVSSKYGIEVTSFDDTINEVNALQHCILFGED